MSENHPHSPELTKIPPPLREGVLIQWQQYLESVHQEGLSVPVNKAFLEVLAQVWCASQFVAESCIRYPALLDDLLSSGDLLRDYTSRDYPANLKAGIAKITDEQTLATKLRQFRRREMVRIAWRDLAGWVQLDEVLRDLSWLAEACIDGALAKLTEWEIKASGKPIGKETNQVQSMVVIGMGKLGAWELNFSSDIDLIFSFPEEGETRGKSIRISNEEFFVRLGRNLVNILDESTEDGFVYRTDMRLRPFGDSGPLAMSFDAMEEYYQSHGREWERYAFIKARVVAGDKVAGKQLMSILKPFVYRRYLDYGTFESLREMKQMISREVERKGMESNIKLGLGGIREVEFIGQAFQLIRGGREIYFQEREIQKVLTLLGKKNYLPDYVVEDLLKAYVFLRRVENRLQAFNDEQKHSLPDDKEEQLRLAWSMEYKSWNAFKKDMDNHRSKVQSHFEQVFSAPQTDSGNHAGHDASTQYKALWRRELSDNEATLFLKEQGFNDTDNVLGLIEQLHDSSSYQGLSSQGHSRMDRLMPLLLGAVSGCEQQDICLQRLMQLIESIARRSVYLALLVENPMALSQLVKLCAASPWIAELLTMHPVLFDELIDPRMLYAPLDKEKLRLELISRLASIADDDLEQQMEVLRHFKQSNVLRVAAADITGAIPLMVVSDHLTAIAEQILQQVLIIVWSHLVARHGTPHCKIKGKDRIPGFIIVGYGKLGGIELGYGSDLDIVFIHDSIGEDQMTQGKNPIDNAQFFARLGQRIIHMLNSLTPSGVLYEVDTRLRPSGASGLLVTSIDAFTEYQTQDAWTWEHQALVRARVVAGDAEIGNVFEKTRSAILSRQRKASELQKDVRDMREKMRTELGSHDETVFDLKQDRGGIADIEFIVQYAVLRWSHDYPILLEYTDNIRILDGLVKSNLLSKKEGDLLADAYRIYRARLHRCVLEESAAQVSADEYIDLRKAVQNIWQKWLES
ncbi:MAG: bifunctional [glutamate--ammonia ligase]-adenylyl-L-tyrosine phosphorylase/[glutamate--ammonia-ligase] adenylyltransferase [Gammaproteobacteria bacterium]|nr:bifunctional [glutamate--ammonia ligase]-adenylyl-L-tyrosine phosphorylase/[glutamate--ammonia-ligase] adenylyltransferase [Gammaproteobacteria bacterium]